MLKFPVRLRKLKKTNFSEQNQPLKTTEQYHHDPVAIEQEIEEKDSELLRVKSFFPIDLFPNELIIRKKTVSIIKRNLFSSYNETFLVKDIGLVSINNAILFSEIRVSYKAPYEDMVINKLLKSEAKQAKSLLDKLMLVRNDDEIDDDVAINPSIRDLYYRAAS